MIYKTFVDRLICPTDMIIDELNIWSVIRGNSHYLDKLLNEFSTKNNEYYIHFLDGDDWGSRDIWINGKHQDSSLAMEIFNKFDYKDCVCGFADEFLLIDSIDRTQDIIDIFKNKDYTMTTVIFKGTNIINSWKDIREEILTEVFTQKGIQKGTITNFNL